MRLKSNKIKLHASWLLCQKDLPLKQKIQFIFFKIFFKFTKVEVLKFELIFKLNEKLPFGFSSSESIFFFSQSSLKCDFLFESSCEASSKSTFTT